MLNDQLIIFNDTLRSSVRPKISKIRCERRKKKFMMAVWNAVHSLCSFKLLYFSFFFCGAVQCKANPTNQKKLPVAVTKKKKKKHRSNKKCGDNSVDGILIMRAKQQQPNNNHRKNWPSKTFV